MRSLLIALALISVTTANNQVCTPGTYFTTDCNTCVCNYEGRAVCTKKACQTGFFYPGGSSRDPVDQVHHIIPGISEIEVDPSVQVSESHSASYQVCTPNSVFNIDCNRCRCTAFGDTYTCTKIACQTNQPGNNQYPTQNKPNQQYPQQSVPNYLIPSKPNHQIIPSVQIGESHSAFYQVCTPNSVFNIDCNRCWCTVFGDTYTCTKFACQANEAGWKRPSDNQYPTQDKSNQQYPQQNVPNYVVPSNPSQQYPQQNAPTYPLPHVPDQQHQSPQPTFPNQQDSTQHVPNSHHKHAHGCGHHHKRRST